MPSFICQKLILNKYMVKRKQSDVDLDSIPYAADRPLGSKRAKKSKGAPRKKTMLQLHKLKVREKHKVAKMELKKAIANLKATERDLRDIGANISRK